MPFIQVGGYRGGLRKVTPVYAEIDEEDVERVSQYNWGQNKQSSKHTTYAFVRIRGEKILLHRFIMGLDNYKNDKRIIDHKDGNGLNNKKDNLTICDIMYNSQSFRRHNGNTNVGYVYYDTSMKRIKRWKATVTVMGKRHQQRFLTEEEAHVFIQKTISNHI
jgi:hypothetical protein